MSFPKKSDVKWLKSSGVGLTLRYCPQHIMTPVALRYISAPYNPIRPKIMHMYETRDRNTLWWRATTSHLLPEKKVVRVWCARRARRAFKHALKKQGFDEVGHPLIPGEQEVFKGSMEVIACPPLITMKYETLEQEADTLLAKIMELRARARDRPQRPSKSHTRPSKKP